METEKTEFFQEKKEKPSPRSDNVTDRTYEALRLMIRRGDLGPGDVLEERRLSEDLDVSRTPLRAAISRLLGENLLTRLSNRTLIVQNLTHEDFLEIIHIRKLLEGDAAALAAGHLPHEKLSELRTIIREFEKDGGRAERHWEIDDLFHETIAAASNNRNLKKLISDIRSRARMCNIGKIPERLRDACEEHLAILDALEDGNSELARNRMVEHIDKVRQGFFALLGTPLR